VDCARRGADPLNNLRQQSTKGFDKPSGYWRSLSISDWHFTKQDRDAETHLAETVHQPSGNFGIRQ
jgi:hypothetical protein